MLNSFRLAATVLACAAALTAAPTQAATYFTVLPLQGANAAQAQRAVKMALAGATPPPATVGVPYSFNFGALLSLDGPEGTDPANVRWSVVSGELPAGLELVGSEVVGTPTELAAGHPVVIQAEYASGYNTVGAIASYSFAVPEAPIVDFGGYRAWADGTFAQSCEGYIRSGSESYPYRGAVGDGVYRISPTGTAMDVYCDQTADSGGWALLMKQAAHDGETLQGDTDYWINGTVLNDAAAGRSMADGNFVSAAFAQLPVASFRLQAANETTARYRDNAAAIPGLIAFSDAQRAEYSDPSGVWAPSAPNWLVHTDSYPNGHALSSARFSFNARESGKLVDGRTIECAVRWGWMGNDDSGGSFDVCGGLGAWGGQYGSMHMSFNKSAWNPATLYLWGR